MTVKLFEPSKAGFVYQNLLFSKPSVRKSETMFNDAQNQLATAYHVSPPKHDAYQVVITERARQKVRSLSQSIEAAQNGMLQMKIATTGLKSAKKVLEEMKKLALMAANSSTLDGDRTTLNTKLTELPSDLNQLVSRTTYNKKKLLDGSYVANFKLGTSNAYAVKIQIDDFRTSALQLNNLDISTQTGATSAFTKIDDALKKMKENLGRVQAADKKLGTILSTQTNLMETLLDKKSSLRSRSAAKDMLEMINAQLLTPDAAVISPKQLHKTNNNTVLDLLANAIDLPFRP